jgi:hypothetical protein
VWPLERLLALELALAVGVITACGAFMIKNAPAIVFKARFTGVLTAIQPLRHALVEHFATAGTWLESDVLAAEIEHGSGGKVEEFEAALSGKSEKARAAARAALKEDPYSGALSFRAGILDGTIVALGTARGLDQPFQVVIRPAVAAGEAPWSVQWLCGSRETPPGWVSPSEPIESNLPPQFLLSACRKGAQR